MQPQQSPPKARFDLPEHWQQFLLCLLFHLLLPLAPIAIEYFTIGYMKTSTLTISAAMYAISIGTSSKSPLEFGLYIAGSFIFAVMFGVHSANESIIPAERLNTALSVWNNSKTSAVLFMVLVVVIHGFARYNRHIVFRQPFWEFLKKEGDAG